MKRVRVLSVAVLTASLMAMSSVAALAAVPKLNKKSASLTVGSSTTLKVKNAKKTVKWKSSKPAIVKVKKVSKNKAKITALKPGISVVTAKVGSKKLKIRVNVKKKNTPVVQGCKHNWVKKYKPVYREGERFVYYKYEHQGECVKWNVYDCDRADTARDANGQFRWRNGNGEAIIMNNSQYNAALAEHRKTCSLCTPKSIVDTSYSYTAFVYENQELFWDDTLTKEQVKAEYTPAAGSKYVYINGVPYDCGVLSAPVSYTGKGHWFVRYTGEPQRKVDQMPGRYEQVEYYECNKCGRER